MDVADVVGRDEELMLFKDKKVSDEVILDRGVVASGPYLTLLVWRLVVQRVEHDLVL